MLNKNYREKLEVQNKINKLKTYVGFNWLRMRHNNKHVSGLKAFDRVAESIPETWEPLSRNRNPSLVTTGPFGYTRPINALSPSTARRKRVPLALLAAKG